MYAGAWVSQHVESSWRADRCAWKEHTTKFWTIHRSVTSILEERCPVLRQGSNAHDSSSPTARSSPNECCRPNRAMIGKVCLRPVGTRGGRGDGWGPCACPGGLTSGLGCVRPTGLLPTRTSTRPNTFQIGGKRRQGKIISDILPLTSSNGRKAERILASMYRVRYLEQNDKMSQQVRLG